MKKIILLILLSLFVIFFLVGCQPAEEEITVRILAEDKDLRIFVEVADTPEKIHQGLMFRESLGENNGMVFIFEGEDYRSFWMKNTLIPLDIIFVNSNSTIIDIKENFQPCEQEPCESYRSKEKATHAVEVNAGFVEKNNITEGDFATVSIVKTYPGFFSMCGGVMAG